jgi:lysophospholipase L1-like esterase
MANPFLWFLIAGALLLIAEVAARFLLPANPSFKARQSLNLAFEPSGFVCYFPTPNQVIFERDEGKVLQDKPRYRINSYGYRGEECPVEKSEGEIRIVFLGGSHVFDVVSYDYRGDLGFPHLVQARFREAGYNVRVINAGLPGNDTRYFAPKLILDLHRLRPDIVIASSIWNDLKWISRADKDTLFARFSPKAIRKNPMTERVNFLDAILGFSAIYRNLRDSYWRRKLKLQQDKVIHEGIPDANLTDAGGDYSRGLEQYRQNLSAVVSLSRSIGAVPVLAIEERLVGPEVSEEDKRKIPYHMVNVRTHAELAHLFTECEAVMEAVAAESDVSLINLQPEMEGRAEHFFDHIHTSSKGSRFIAERYFEFLKSIVDERVSQRLSASTIR